MLSRRSDSRATRSGSGLYCPPLVPAKPEPKSQSPRHAAFVRWTHWLTVVSFLALLITGCEIIVSHPRFYWGETGNVNMKPLFSFPIPSSRDTVPTGFNYVMPDQNGWSRYLHFQSGWLLVFTGFVYFVAGLFSGHFRHSLIPAPSQRSWRAVFGRIALYLRRAPAPDESRSYNVLQRLTYLAVIFGLFPFAILTGLALSPGFNSAFPFIVDSLGGRQSARTLHFVVTVALVFFFVIHVLMVAFAGFWSRTRAMITGHSPERRSAAAPAAISANLPPAIEEHP